MRIFVNRKAVRGPWGGENSFIGALCRWLESQGHSIVADRAAPVDIALLNALTQIDLDFVRQLAERGIPIVHRKVGFAVSGGPELREEVNGVVRGNALQLEFSPFIQHSIFQSAYSRDVFLADGFTGPHSVIANGVDDAIFNMDERRLFGFAKRKRDLWNGRAPFDLVISSWSKDLRKGFPEYGRIDAQLDGHDELRVTLVGNVPDGYRFRNIRVISALPHRRLAALFRRHHAMLCLAEQETCSNALLEGLNCGLPLIYLDSGSAKENAAPYGVEYRGDIFEAVHGAQERYHELVARIPDNPFRISLVAPRYLGLFHAILAGRTISDEAPAA